MARIIVLWLSIFTFCMSANVMASQDCMSQAGITAMEFFNLNAEERKKVDAFTCLAPSGRECRHILVNQGVPAFQPPYHVKFSSLYKEYLTALEDKDGAKIRELYESLAPINKPANEVLELAAVKPPGGFAKAEALANVFEYKKTNRQLRETLEKYPDWFLPFLYIEMGGDPVEPTSREVVFKREQPWVQGSIKTLSSLLLNGRYQVRYEPLEQNFKKVRGSYIYCLEVPKR